MRIYVTTAGGARYHDAQCEHFRSLAACDEVGEHELVEDPVECHAVLFVDLQQHPRDPFLRALRRHPLVRQYPTKIFVYDERDLPFVTYPGIYVSATDRLARRHPVVGGPYPAVWGDMQADQREPDLLFSFSGACTHPVRKAVLNLRHGRCAITDTSAFEFPSWLDVITDEAQHTARREYAATVARSKFVLCPRGHSPSSFRLYETLSAGRVPVVISDDWLPPPRIDWRACALRVRQCDVAGIPSLLERLEPLWPQMAAAAAMTFDEHFSRARLWHHYASSLAGLEATPPRWPWWAQRQVMRLGVRRARSATVGMLRQHAAG